MRTGRTVRGSGVIAAIVSLALVITGLLSGTYVPSTVSAARASVPVSDPSASTDPWEPVTLQPLTPIARLEPSERDTYGIAPDATFALTSLGEAAAAELARTLTVEPDLDLLTEPGDDPLVATLRPVAPLEPGRQLRFTLRGEDGALLGSWVFRVRSPLHVVSTLPGNMETYVPLDTGIEITFDQDGALEPERYFDIEPSVRGRFETHGRVLAFIPRKPLEAESIYSVTLRAGIPMAGSDMRLDEDVRFAFQTEPERRRREPAIRFEERVAEASTREPASIMVRVWRPTTTTLPVEVYRFGSLQAAEEALRAAQGPTSWAASGDLALPTAGLRLMDTFQAETRRLDAYDPSSRSVSLPGPLPAGWYLVVIPDEAADAQLILQVTDLSAYSHITLTRSLFWVNDVATGQPVQGAKVSLAGGRTLGRTDADGLLEIATSEPLRTTDPLPILLVRSADRAVFVPFGVGAGWYRGNVDWGDAELSVADRYWSFLYTDREAYRSTDAVNVWGMLRERTDERVPQRVELRLVTGEDWGDARSPALVTTQVQPSSAGVFSGSLGFTDLPLGGYIVQARIDGEPAGEAWVTVARIVKPAYRLSVSTDRRIYLDGDPVRATLDATFFEGTAVPGAPLALRSTGASRAAVTDATGRAVARLEARYDNDYGDQYTIQTIVARPNRAEEGEIEADTSIVVFSSSLYLVAEARLEDGQVRLRGNVHQVALKRLESEAAAGTDLGFDPRGRAVGGVTISARVTELIPTRRQIGTVYDFIAKKVVPVYEYDERQRPAGTRQLVSGGDGSFSIDLAARQGSGYSIDLAATDEAGRTTRLLSYAERPFREDPGTQAFLARAGARDTDCGRPCPFATVSVGERLAVELHQGADRLPTGGSNRYLFVVQQVGLRRAVVQRSPVLSLTFRDADVPMLEIGAVRFTGTTYVAVPDGFSARLRSADRRLRIELSPDRARYAPGEHVVLGVRTTDPDGRPVQTSVVLRGVDEKLFATGLAREATPLEDLYTDVWSGTLRTYATHLLPIHSPGDDSGGAGGGDGGGGRQDFRDMLLFEQVTTDAVGRATVSFDLSDDLTSWRVSATAVSERLEAGEATTLVPVGLPFFVELVAAPEYLETDQAAVRVRAYGPALRRGDAVTFSVSAPSLGMAPRTVTGTAFQSVDVVLPDLVAGTHAITVEGSSGSGSIGGTGPSDAMTRRITVLPSRLEQTRAQYLQLTSALTPPGGQGLTTVIVSDAGRGRFYPALMDLATFSGPRADQALAAAEARHLLTTFFNVDPASLPAALFDRTQFQRRNGGIALLPYAGGSEELSLLVALAAPDAIDRTSLGSWFQRMTSRKDLTQERALRGWSGRAALGEPVLDDLLAIAREGGLSTVEWLYLALGAAAAGDHETALGIERDLLARHGQRLGPWIRLKVGGAEATALLSILAATLGDDDVAVAADAFVRENPPTDTLASLERIAFIARSLERATTEPASFAWTLEGERQVVDLGPGETHRMVLTAEQRAALRLEPLSGSLVVAASWGEPLDPTTLTQDVGIAIERTVVPAGPVPAADIVEVSMQVDLGPSAVRGCYLVTDMAPSGLAPLREGATWPSRRKRDRADVLEPLSVSGQRVTFCVARDKRRPVQTLRYRARVVTPGTYLWEPTLVQSVEAPESRRLGEPSTLVLR